MTEVSQSSAPVPGDKVYCGAILPLKGKRNSGGALFAPGTPFFDLILLPVLAFVGPPKRTCAPEVRFEIQGLNHWPFFVPCPPRGCRTSPLEVFAFSFFLTKDHSTWVACTLAAVWVFLSLFSVLLSCSTLFLIRHTPLFGPSIPLPRTIGSGDSPSYPTLFDRASMGAFSALLTSWGVGFDGVTAYQPLSETPFPFCVVKLTWISAFRFPMVLLIS